MHILVTGGSGVIGTAAIRALLDRGHTIRALSRGASQDVERWPEGVEARPGDVTDPDSLIGCADGCDAVLHIVGIVAEAPPLTFASVNVEGTRLLLEEATRAGTPRFVFVSSLGANDGASEYHRSKLRAERLVEEWPAHWTICRPGNVYGPGDEVISLVLKMIHTLPLIPVVGGGDQPFQPVWADDLGEALARVIEREDLAKRTLALAGAETTTMKATIEELAGITGRTARTIGVPSVVAEAGVRMAESLGVKSPVNSGQLVMLREHNVIRPGEHNALTGELGVTPIPYREGLRLLAVRQPESVPEGGRLWSRRYWAELATDRSAMDVFALVRDDLATLLPEGIVEVQSSSGGDTTLRPGRTLTMSLPLRGIVQVRVQEMSDASATCVTLAGHPLSGGIRFSAQGIPSGVRFLIETWDRPASLADRAAALAGGNQLKHATWFQTIQNLINRTGAKSALGVQASEEKLSEEASQSVGDWLRSLVTNLQRGDEERRVAAF